MQNIRFQIILSFLVFVLVFGVVSYTAARTERIVAVVNEDVISASDLDDRIKLIILSSNLPNNEDTRERLTGQVLDSLIDEQIRLQEAERLEIEITEEEIDQGFAKIASQNDILPEEFKKMLEARGINLGTMRRQIASQLAWSKVVQSEMRPKVIITPNDVENVQERWENSIGSHEYRVAEIFLPVEDPQKETNTRQLAERLVSQINSGKAPFSKLAQQFSKSAGAAQGGDLGWVHEGQLAEELENAIKQMNEGTISSPIRSLSGYHILLLLKKRLITEENIPGSDRITSQIGLERLDRLQKRYFLDLKASAFIENRIES